MTTLRKFSQSPWMEIVLILLIAAVTYLPHLSQATIYRDDWYYVMDRTIGGPGTFQQMFSIDRPARGPLFEVYYRLFGIQPFPYHMSSFFWRILGGLAALWLFRQLWPRQRLATFLMALLFVLYPGYLRWMEGFEDQPRILSSFLEVLSIALTLLAIRTSRTFIKVLAWISSILLGWAYIALVDFSFGMEVFRFLCVFILVNHDQATRSFRQKTISAIRAWWIAAIIPAGYLFWRLFVFNNERAATDIGLQLGQLTTSPLMTVGVWSMRLFQSAVDVAILAWNAPLFQNLFELTLPEILIGLLLAVIAVALLWVSFSRWKMDAAGERWQNEAIWVGLIGVFMGVVPVIVANRYVSFDAYSHYALPASLASVMMVVGVVFLINSQTIRFGVASVLVLFAVLTHYTVSLRILHEQEIIANFWQQVVWRAPGIKSGTTLLVNYPSVHYAEDVDAVSGPANFIYYPEQTNQIPAVYQLIGLPQMDYTTKDVLRGINRKESYRTHVGELNSSNMLVISQPTTDACVHVIDSRWPNYSSGDPDQILLLGQYSKIENVLTEGSSPKLAQTIFGPEPEHTWCYYYQQAERALQEGDWEKIVQIGDQAAKLNQTPADKIEWAPFMQAYAATGNEKSFQSTAEKIKRLPFVRKGICDALLAMQATGSTFTPEIQSLMNDAVCRGQVELEP
jgi:hypothetical protein